MTKILFFPASLRRQSHQKRLADYLAGLLADRCEIDMLDSSDVNLPLFNQDLESDSDVVVEVIALHDRVASADGLVVASPEYNGHVSPYLKNTVDWVSRLCRIDARFARINPFRDKPLLLCSASTGWSGGALGLRDARSLFGYLGCLVVQDEITLPKADRAMTQDGYFFQPQFIDSMKDTMTDYLALVTRCRGA